MAILAYEKTTKNIKKILFSTSVDHNPLLRDMGRPPALASFTVGLCKWTFCMHHWLLREPREKGLARLKIKIINNISLTFKLTFGILDKGPNLISREQIIFLLVRGFHKKKNQLGIIRRMIARQTEVSTRD